MKDIRQMDHNEALESMAAEKYLLDELSPEMREAFEEHMFDCPECAYDVRAGAAFVDEAKLQLPGLTADLGPQRPKVAEPEPKKRGLFDWLRPLFATPAFGAPVFATLLVVIGYQNFATIPTLRSEVSEPRLMPAVSLHAGTRAGGHTVVQADRHMGVVLLVDVPQQTAYASYAVDLYDPQGKLAWTRKFAAAASGSEDGSITVMLPGAGLQQGSYALAISGVNGTDAPVEIERQVFDIRF